MIPSTRTFPALALLVLAACIVAGPLDDPTPGDDPTPEPTPVPCDPVPDAPDAEFRFGVATFEVSADAATAWTHAGAVADLHLRWGTEPDDLPWCMPVTAGDDTIATGRIDGLVAGEQYWFRFEVGETRSAVGRFRTAPPAGSPVRFVMSGDVHAGNPQHWTLFDDMAAHDADFYLSLGDWPYADSAETEAEYHLLHQAAHDDDRIRNFLGSLGLYAVFDDHEVSNDWDAEFRAAHPDEVEAGLAVWARWFGLDRASDTYHRSFRRGDLEFFALDTRSRRDARTDPDDLDGAGLPSKTMLGAEQRDWLLAGLRASDARFKVVLSSVPLDFGTTGSDHWPGYARERDLILDTVVNEGLRGVVFVTADQHWFTANHHNAGIKEFQVGPISAGLRTPYRGPNSRGVDEVRNYGLIDYDPDEGTLTFSARTHGGVEFYREVVHPGRGRIEVRPGAPASFSLCPVDDADGSAHTFTGVGDTDFELAMPGTYRAEWAAALPGWEASGEGQELVLEDGGEIVFEGAYDRVPIALPFSDPFDEDRGWMILDEGTTDAPSDWRLEGGTFVEASNIYDVFSGDPGPIEKLGTVALHGDPDWGDVRFSARVRTPDDDGLGLIFRAASPTSYHRCSFDAQRGFARLVRRDGDEFTLLDEVVGIAPYTRDAWTELEAVAVGDSLACFVDGSRLLEATDGTFATGGVGLYSWGSAGLAFDDVSVVAP